MKIKYLKVKNFLSISNDPIEIDFTKYGNIVNVKGRNLDAGEGGSNGVGKSSIASALIYGLYGKLIKELNHKEAINNKTKKNLEVEVGWEDQLGNDYKVIRSRSPDKVQLFENGKDISTSKPDDEIKKKIKLNHNSFINVSYFGQHNVKSFLNCEPKDKRSIAENLLSLDKYTRYCKNAKDKLKILKDKSFTLSTVYENLLKDLSSTKKKKEVLLTQQKLWKDKKQNDVQFLDNKIHEKEMSLFEIKTNQEVFDYEKIQSELSLIEEEISKKEASRSNIHNVLEKSDLALQQRREEKQTFSIEASSLARELAITNKEIAHEQSHEEKTICSECEREYPKEDIAKSLERRLIKVKELKIKWKEIKAKIEEIDKQLSVCNQSIDKLMDGRRLVKEKEIQNLSSLNDLMQNKKRLIHVKKPDIISEVNLVSKDIEYLKEKRTNLLIEKNPYVEMLEMIDKDIEEYEGKVNLHKGDLKSLEMQMPYYEFWVRAFGDSGIRSFMIDEIMPALNGRINYWLQYLMDGRIQFHFDNQLNEKIERVPIDKDPFVYHSLSGGEIGRIDLAISQAFAHVTSLTSGINNVPSLCFLDEVGANIDRPGIQAIFKMIQELSRDRQVFVVSHDPDLLDLLEGYDSIELEMKNGTTRLVG